jgi:drug/metabolite transporter (DMT)-like permease
VDPKTETLATIMNPHLIAVFQALVVVFLWATSWVFIKIGLREIPPVTFAGLRYSLAFVCLLCVLLFKEERREIKAIPKRTWVRLLVLGLLFYAATQGTSFVALAYLPAVTVNLIWSFSSVSVALLGVAWLSEKPTLFQWGGIFLAVAGAVLYFYPVAIPKNQVIGFLVAGLGVLANAVSAIMGRELNRSKTHHPLVITVISMGTGALVLLITGFGLEGLPVISLTSWAIILWLAVINTALAFTLWNHTLRTLTAVESSIINGTMMIWIPVFAVVFLGEQLTGKGIIGIVLVGIGTLFVQLRRFPNGNSRIPG